MEGGGSSDSRHSTDHIREMPTTAVLEFDSFDGHIDGPHGPAAVVEHMAPPYHVLDRRRVCSRIKDALARLEAAPSSDHGMWSGLPSWVTVVMGVLAEHPVRCVWFVTQHYVATISGLLHDIITESLGLPYAVRGIVHEYANVCQLLLQVWGQALRWNGDCYDNAYDAATTLLVEANDQLRQLLVQCRRQFNRVEVPRVRCDYMNQYYTIQQTFISIPLRFAAQNTELLNRLETEGNAFTNLEGAIAEAFSPSALRWKLCPSASTPPPAEAQPGGGDGGGDADYPPRR